MRKEKQIMIRVDSSLDQFITEQAALTRQTKSEWIRQLIWRAHDKESQLPGR